MSAIHICVDMYKEDLQHGPGLILLNNVRTLINACDERDILTIYVAFSPTIDYPEDMAVRYNDVTLKLKDLDDLTRNVLLNDPCDGIALDLNEDSLVALKLECSAYPATIDYVKPRQFPKIIISGMLESDDLCVWQTARDFRAAGYEVVIAAEATECGVRGIGFFRPIEERRAAFAKIGVNVEPMDVIMRELDRTTELTAKNCKRPEQQTIALHSTATPL